MAKINLLPWRLERRKLKQKEFITMLVTAAAIAVGLSILIVLYYNGQISGQEGRNNYLTTEIANIDKQIEVIKDLDKQKADLLGQVKQQEKNKRELSEKPKALNAQVVALLAENKELKRQVNDLAKDNIRLKRGMHKIITEKSK